MSVYIESAVWPTNIPYVCTDPFALDWIPKFNQTVQRKIFVPRASESDYVEFSPSTSQSHCEVGRSGGQQTLSYKPSDQKALLHEMCHCCGLGHENFHTNWPYRMILRNKKDPNGMLSLHALQYNLLSPKYTTFGPYDAKSIMLYGNDVMFTAADQVDLTPSQATTLSVLDAQAVTSLYPNAESLHTNAQRF